MITIIAAASENNVIGNKGQIPWRLPNDFKMFKETTLGHDIIMGRKTFESLPGILPKRRHWVITRNKSEEPNTSDEDIVYVDSLVRALQLTNGANKEVFIIGGGEIYAQALKYAHRILLTRVFTECIGDAFFPRLYDNQFRLVKYEYHEPDDNHQYAYAFMEYKLI